MKIDDDKADAPQDEQTENAQIVGDQTAGDGTVAGELSDDDTKSTGAEEADETVEGHETPSGDPVADAAEPEATSEGEPAAEPDYELEDSGDDDAAAVTYEDGRPLVHELQYQEPKAKSATAATEDETPEVKFSSVAEAKSVIEGFLFSCNEPLSVSKLSKLMSNLHPKTVRGLLIELQWEYENRPGGLQVVEIAGGYQMCTRPFVAPWMFRMHKHKRRSALSPATLETLAIVAYRQPITKGEIEGIRGVESGAPLRTLQELSMVEASGRREVIGRPQLYVTTEQFLKAFGLKSVGDLPSIAELKSRFAEEQKLKPIKAAPAKPEEPAETEETEIAMDNTAEDTVGNNVTEEVIDENESKIPESEETANSDDEIIEESLDESEIDEIDDAEGLDVYQGENDSEEPEEKNENF